MIPNLVLVQQVKKYEPPRPLSLPLHEQVDEATLPTTVKWMSPGILLKFEHLHVEQELIRMPHGTALPVNTVAGRVGNEVHQG